MSQQIWINGKICPLADAKIGVEDRGFQFADGVYEVIKLYNGRLFALGEHLERLERSCEGVRLGKVFDRQTLAKQITQFAKEDAPAEGMIYLQITRGVSPRNHGYPEKWQPTILFYGKPLPALNPPGGGPGITLQTVTDERWRRCWIKSIALLPNVLAKNQAIDAGADEAVFVENGTVNECSTSNFFVVIRNQLVTHPVGPKVLPGITRLVLLQLAAQIGIDVVERPISLEEAKAAGEVFISNTTHEIEWVSRWDEKVIGKQCGPITKQLHEAFVQRVQRETAPTSPVSLANV
jgi:D-alanine transaminase